MKRIGRRELDSFQSQFLVVALSGVETLFVKVQRFRVTKVHRFLIVALSGVEALFMHKEYRRGAQQMRLCKVMTQFLSLTKH